MQAGRYLVLMLLLVLPVHVVPLWGQVAAQQEQGPLQQSGSGKLWTVGKDGVTQPQIIHKVNPHYTKEAKRQHIVGACTLELTVDERGLAHDATVIHSLAEGRPEDQRAAAASLDSQAIEAIQQYRFKPSTRDGLPVAVRIRVEVNFGLIF
ncbi:energy transducer TonB [Acidipila sp. EB88]|nr:energy transducer TonB [Acidipila sp. EB88]